MKKNEYCCYWFSLSDYNNTMVEWHCTANATKFLFVLSMFYTVSCHQFILFWIVVSVSGLSMSPLICEEPVCVGWTGSGPRYARLSMVTSVTTHTHSTAFTRTQTLDTGNHKKYNKTITLSQSDLLLLLIINWPFWL